MDYQSITANVLNAMRVINAEPLKESVTKLKGQAGRSLMDAVELKLKTSGITDESAVNDAMCLYARSLAKGWHGRDVMSTRIAQNYLVTVGAPKKNNDPAGNEKAEKAPETQAEAGPTEEETEEEEEEEESEETEKEEEESEEEEEEESEEEEEEESENVDPEEDPQEEPTEKVECQAEEEEIEIDPSGYVKPPEYDLIKSLLLEARVDVLAYGDAGCGKSDIGIRIAEEAGIPLHMITAPQYGTDVTGFLDANGHFNESEPVKAFREGGLLLIDEWDRAMPEAQIAFNGGIANGYLSTPGGVIRRHPDLVIYATSNTVGLGCTDEFNTANKMDASSRDRMFFIEVGFSKEIDMVCAEGDRALVEFAEQYRKAVNTAGVRDAMLSYRGVRLIKKTSDMLGTETAMKGALLKGMSKDNIMSIYEGLTNRMNKYAMTMRQIYDQMPDEF